MFYRPMYGDLGYGGTRYFPLHFVLHAALMKIGLGPEAAGHALEGVACLALLFGIYRVLRQLRIAPATAACLSTLVLAPKATQIAILSIRGDLLPTALTVLGLATCMSAKLERRHLLGASLLFTLAFAAKPTSLFGGAAVFLSFVFSRQARKAARLSLATGLGCAAVLGVVSLASQNRFLTVFRACATTAGYNLRAGLSAFLTAPVLELPIDLVFMVLGFAGFLALLRTKGSGMPAMFFASAAASTIIVLGAKGANINHFLDIDVASLIIFSAWLFDEETREKNFGLALLVFVAVFATRPILWSLRTADYGGYFDFAYSRGLHETVEFLGEQHKPILAAHPLLPILDGQRPYLLDVWMFTMVAEKDPSFAKSMSEAIRERRFGAIVLEDDLESRTRQYFFPGRLTEDVRQNYQLARRSPGAYVFLPRGREDTTAPPESRSAGQH